MRTSIIRCVAVLALAGLAACSTDTSPTHPLPGPVASLILSGNHQTGQVGGAALPEPVGVLVYRNAAGQLATRVLPRVPRLLARVLLPAAAYADTVVHLKGIPNQVACWGDVQGQPRLIPDVPCALTDSTGQVAFTVRPDTIAGTALGRVAVDSSGVTLVTDSVQATITPGPLASWLYASNASPYATKDSAVKLVTYFTHFTDAYHNVIVADSVVAHVKVRSAWAHFDPLARPDQCVAAGTPTDSGWTPTAPDSVASWGTSATGPNACVWLWIGATDTANAVINLRVQ